MLLCLLLSLGACSKDPKAEISDRLAREMQAAGRGANDAERRQVADALAEDAVALAAEAPAIVAAQEQAAREIEARHGTPAQAIAEECLSLRTSIERLEQIERDPSSGERHTAEELAALPDELNRARSKLRELCPG